MILRHRERQPGNSPTNKRMKNVRKELFQKTGTYTTINEIWTKNEKGVISPKISDFLWKLCHNKHKVGTWFLRIKGWEDRAHCKCGKLETMNHILIECPLNQGRAIWNYMKEEWEQNLSKTSWLKPTIELIRGLGSIQLKNKPRWMNEAYIERTAEAIWMIWTLRNNRLFNKKVIPERPAIKMLKEALRRQNGPI